METGTNGRWEILRPHCSAPPCPGAHPAPEGKEEVDPCPASHTRRHTRRHTHAHKMHSISLKREVYLAVVLEIILSGFQEDTIKADLLPHGRVLIL